MKKVISLLIFSIVIALIGCEDPFKPEDKEKILWVTQLEEEATAALVMDENYIYFNGVSKDFYKVNKISGEKMKIEISPGAVFGAPQLWNDFIYTGTSGGTISCLNKTSLAAIWTKGGFSWVTITAVDEQYLYVTEQNKVTAFGKENGEIIWSTTIIGKNIFNPLLDNGKIYFATGSLFKQDGYLYCIDKTNGEIIYNITIPYMESRSQFGGSSSGVGIWEDYIYVPADNRYLYCFNKNNGALIWEFLMDSPSETPARISDGIVYTGTLNRTCYAVDALNGQLIWSYQTIGSIRRIPPQFQGENVAFISGSIIICNKKTGKLLKDISYGRGSDYIYYAALWDLDGKMYLTGNGLEERKSVVLVYQF